MKKLTKHANFKDLKSEAKSAKATSLKDKRLMSEFETFLNQLHHQHSINKNAVSTNGKKSG